MSVKAGELVDQARDTHPGFDRSSIPDKGALRALGRLQRRLAEKVVLLSEEALARPVRFTRDEVNVALLAGPQGEGLPLGEQLFVLRAATRYLDAREGDPGVPVSLVAYSMNTSDMVYRWPAAYIAGQRLYPIPNPYNGAGRYYSERVAATTVPGLQETGWAGYDGLDVLAVPVPPQLASLDSILTLPSVTHDALVENLALWMANRKGVIRDLPDLPRIAKEAEEAAVQALAGQDRSSTWMIV